MAALGPFDGKLILDYIDHRTEVVVALSDMVLNLQVNCLVIDR